MKKFATIALLATSLVTSASAAITAGLEAGYLTDSKEAYWAGRVGWEFTTTTTLSHQVELELGHTEQTERILGITGASKLTPFTINYRAETTAANKLGFYGGAGVGKSRVGLSLKSNGQTFYSDSDNAFAYQAFAGLSYQVSPATKLHAGVRYIKIGDVRFLSQDIEVGDDLALTAGVSVRF